MSQNNALPERGAAVGAGGVSAATVTRAGAGSSAGAGAGARAGSGVGVGVDVVAAPPRAPEAVEHVVSAPAEAVEHAVPAPAEGEPGTRATRRGIWRFGGSRIGGSLMANELRTMFRRNRNLVLLAALAAIPIAIGIAIKVALRHHGANAGGFLAQVSNNGLFLVFASLSLTLPIFLPMALGVVAGDSISGEAAQGTLRYLLVAPVGRVRLLAVKGVSLIVFCLVSTAVVSIAALATGLALFPSGPVTLLSGDSIGMGAATVKAVWITLLVAASLLGLAALGLFFSTLTDTPIAAMAVATGVTILCGILQVIPQLSAIQPWLYTAQWPSYADVLRNPVYLPNIEHNLVIQAGYVAVFTLAAWARLTTRDVSS